MRRIWMYRNPISSHRNYLPIEQTCRHAMTALTTRSTEQDFNVNTIHVPESYRILAVYCALPACRATAARDQLRRRRILLAVA